MQCDRCGKEMTDSRGTTICGVEITANFNLLDNEYKEFVQKQLGKYALNRQYAFCWECWLDSLFGVSVKRIKIQKRL